jgi:hypothetical protein
MVRPLIEILAEIPDFRKAKGKRHKLSAILALACVATMCGYKGYRAFSEWGSNYGAELMKALGFTHVKGPCPATFSIIFRNINVELLEKKIGKWAQSILTKLKRYDSIALDGKIAKRTRSV